MPLSPAEQTRLDGLVANLRFKIGDTATPYAFTSEQLETLILEAMARHNPSYTLLSLPMSEDSLVLYLAWIDICVILGMDSAKEFKLTLDGMSIEKDTRVKSYMELAEFLSQKYKDELEAITPASASGDIVMGELVRTSLETDRTVPYFSDQGLQKPYLQPIILSGSDVTLMWSPIFHPSFQRYDILKKGPSDTEFAKVGTKFDSHFVTFQETGLDTGVNQYKIVVYNMNEVGSESNTQEVTVP